MKEDRPWTYQADLFGLCGVVHCLLHGDFLEVVKDPRTKEYMPKQPFKRYHQADLWRPLFRDFLNVPVSSLLLAAASFFIFIFIKYPLGTGLQPYSRSCPAQEQV